VPQVSYGTEFFTPANVNNYRPHSWADVYTPLSAIQALINATLLDYQNFQLYGLRPINVMGTYTATYGPMTSGFMLVYVSPSASSDISQGHLVTITGYYNNGALTVPTIGLANAYPGEYAIGMAIAPILKGSYGVVAKQVDTMGHNTSSRRAGEPVWQNTSTPGGWCYTEHPSMSYGYRSQIVGQVCNISSTAGRILFTLPGTKLPPNLYSEV
jgi:hypothetical protein